MDLAPDTDERINSTNWLYASLRRANRQSDAAQAAAAITPEMTNTAPHTLHYLNLVRLFQGRMTEASVVPPEPPRDGSDTEAELRFDTVAYGVGNWHLYNGEPAKAQEYFRRVLQGKVWITWGFIGAGKEIHADLLSFGGLHGLLSVEALLVEDGPANFFRLRAHIGLQRNGRSGQPVADEAIVIDSERSVLRLSGWGSRCGRIIRGRRRVSSCRGGSGWTGAAAAPLFRLKTVIEYLPTVTSGDKGVESCKE